ncbi:protein NODULATION SIGNALING PATHWAY 1 [Diospyros lotus]|uniref:protein NODULATION SIGNALING PATHWAY 1 n=1 Tax=Diospyros lotus TaxID=55363 RepID=UPI002251A27B|nr:protein NODULATION SIGNALING PATHWAY 1 [Diospyros lotus]
MSLEDSDPNSGSDHVLCWLEGSIPILSSLFEDPYAACDQWWNQTHDLVDQDFLSSASPFDSFSAVDASNRAVQVEPAVPVSPQPCDSSKKRKVPDDPIPQPSQNQRKVQSRPVDGTDDGDAVVEQRVLPKRSAGGKKGSSKAAGNNCHNGNSREERWAEQLLNPCAAAIVAGNSSRVQHLLYVLHELASPTSDANHRLAAHGLRALTRYLSSPISSTKHQFSLKSLMRFDEVSPWFMFPNKIANNSILQVLTEEACSNSNELHIVDIGVSHGVQWPTLLEALTRLPGGPPRLVRLTVVGASATDIPFAVSPPGHSYSSQLLGFAKKMNINLQVNLLEDHPLTNLTTQVINSSPDETLIVCAQFRLHCLSHHSPDNRTEFLRFLRNLEPKGVILSENNMDCSCGNCGDFSVGFPRRVDYLWKFLDSTSAAFKGRETEERRMMELEAAKALTSLNEWNEGKEMWCERMRRVGFVGKGFGEDAIDEARALLRKYDGNWEMRVEDKDGFVGLWWKGQAVSFCSLWRLDCENKSRL